MNYRDRLKYKKKIVIKIGTSTLTFPNGRLNLQRIERLAKVLSDLQKEGKSILLVSSGSIAAGSGRIGLHSKPVELYKKQALAALGQAELIKIYQKFFKQFNQVVAQILLTADVITNKVRNKNARNTLYSLLDMNIIPIINENDTISTDEIEFGDNDTLSAYVATVVGADLLIMLSDIDGLYSADPKTEKNANIIPTVFEITPDLEEMAKGKGTDFATGGMVTKLNAAKVCYASNIDSVIVNGSNPDIINELLRGREIGTYFIAHNISHIKSV